MDTKQIIEFSTQHGFDVEFCKWFFSNYNVGEFATIQMMNTVWLAATARANSEFLKSMGVR